MKIHHHKRSFLQPINKLEDVFFQVVLHEFNAYEFSEKDWKEFAIAYGTLFYAYESLWFEQLNPYQGKTKVQLVEILKKLDQKKAVLSFQRTFHLISEYISNVQYNMEEASIGFIDFHTFAPKNDVNEALSSVFSAIKGSFEPIEHEKGIWLFNAIDLSSHLKQLKKDFDELFEAFLYVDVIDFLNSFIIHSKDQLLNLKQTVSGEKEALTKEFSLQPGMLGWSNDRIIYLIQLKYQKEDGSELSYESIRRTANRMRKTIQ